MIVSKLKDIYARKVLREQDEVKIFKQDPDQDSVEHIATLDKVYYNNVLRRALKANDVSGEEVDTALFKESLAKAGVAPGSDIANSFAVFIKETGMTFKKAEYLAYENISTKTMQAQNRADRYIDFDQMEYMPEIASALDIYADEMTTNNELTAMLKVKCPNEEIKSILETLYFKTLNLESNLFSWSRNMCKYGDFFLYLDIDDKLGITSALGLPSNQIERMEGKDKTNSNYVQFQWNSGGLTFENWQIAHFRILGNDKHSPYGTSVLDPARRIWRQLTLLEDAMMAYRITRSPERKVFYVDVGNVPPEDIEQYMQKVMTQMKRNQILDSNTGRVDLRYNPTSVDEDYFIPVRGGVNNTKIEALAGGQFASAIEDVKYLRDKLFAALKVPMSYLIRGDGATEDKTTLAQKDIRFARTIQRLQRVIVAELEKIGIIHLYTLGFRGTDLISFKLSLNNPSKIAALQELEHWKVKFDVASAATEGYFSKHWVAQNIFGLSDEQIVKIQREMFYDKKFAASLEKMYLFLVYNFLLMIYFLKKKQMLLVEKN